MYIKPVENANAFFFFPLNSSTAKMYAENTFQNGFVPTHAWGPEGPSKRFRIPVQ